MEGNFEDDFTARKSATCRETFTPQGCGNMEQGEGTNRCVQSLSEKHEVKSCQSGTDWCDLVMEPTRQHGNRYVLQPHPARREDVGDGDDSSSDDLDDTLSEDGPPVVSLAAAAPPADSGDAEGGERRAVPNRSRSPIINIPRRSTRQRVL